MDQRRVSCFSGVPAFLVLFSIVALAHSAAGAGITDPRQLTPDSKLIDFENFTGGQVFSGPLVIDGVTFTSLTGTLSILDIANSGWPANGTEVESKTLFPGGEPDSAISIQFANPVSQILLGWGDPNLAGNILRAYDAAGNLLEEGAVALGPTGGVHAAWIGFKRSIADIAKIIVQPNQSLPSGDDYVIDNIYFSEAQPFARTSSRFDGNVEEDGSSNFQLDITFALGNASNGVNPLAENVIVKVGSLFVQLPSGSFSRNKRGEFVFQGVVDSANVKATFKPMRDGYKFELFCTGADLNDSKLPLVTGLAMGDDAGSVILTRLSAQSD
jgi:hypothetical protein